MRLLQLFTLLVSLLSPITSHAGSTVVVELFTSQGCSSCPPADALLRDLSREDKNIIALGWHVDYWDYLGWKDQFSKPEHTSRQAGYRDRWNLRTLYTPQMVIHGETQIVGSHARKARAAIRGFQAESAMIDMRVQVQNGRAQVRISPLVNNLPTADILLVHVTPEAHSDIARGENAGKNIVYVNVVQDMSRLASWDGKTAIDVTGLDISTGAYILLVQAKNHGPILGAVNLR
ncbi:MAG: DUF1223 domain-containing protein [Paracoccaceae bacterium]